MEDEVIDHPEQEAVNEVVEQMQEVAEEQQQEHKETTVPLSALQKERKKRQELELQIQWERQQRQVAQPPVEDTSKYESATKEDLIKYQEEAVRIYEEKSWIRNNPEKYEKVNDLLPDFLKQRPHLAYAINSSPNRYEEAFTLMEALSPKQQAQIKATPPKREAPNAPTAVPKAAAMNEAVDVMQMSDAEFTQWRSAQKRRR